MLLLLACVCLTLAFFNAVLFTRNLIIYAPPRSSHDRPPAQVSVLIPARNEESVIREAVTAALQSKGVEVEVIVLDDQSEDRTADVVREISSQDDRVTLAAAPPLPAGWCGKQFACSVLASLAKHDIFCFIDADVRVKPEGLAKMTGFLRASGAGLVSGFPEQELVTFYERLLLPLMHFLMLSYLPIDSMRKYLAPSLGAGCGQIFVAHRKSYLEAGGHAAIRESRHDGIALPKAFRKAKIKTDLCDASTVAVCRMYHNAGEVMKGLLKNASEGIAAPIRIFVFTFLLGMGHIAPWLFGTYLALTHAFGLPFLFCVFAALLSLLPRLLAVWRFKQPVREAVLHPAALIVFLGLQWYARYLELSGTPAIWKGRSYQAS